MLCRLFVYILVVLSFCLSLLSYWTSKRVHSYKAEVGLMWMQHSGPVHASSNVEATGNIVEATFDFVEATFDIVERIV